MLTAMPDKSALQDAEKTDSRIRSPASRWTWMNAAYFVGVPVLVATYAALNNWAIRHAVGIWMSLAFYTSHAVVPWWITCACTFLAKSLLRHFRPPWLLLLLIGHIASSFTVLPYTNWITVVFETPLPAEQQHPFTTYLSADYWNYLLRAGVIWFGINFLFDRFLRLPMYRYVIPRGYDTHAEGSASAESASAGWGEYIPGFVQRLPLMLAPEDILAIKAEQHYVKVITPEKNYMVLYRFSDAVNEISNQPGQQVHRSFWVGRDAIKTVHAKAKDFYLLLENGEKIPVSGPYQGLIRELVRMENIPLHH